MKYQPLECVDVGDIPQLVAIFSNHMESYWFDMLPLDEFEKFKAGGVKQVIAGHGLVNNVKYEPEGIIVRHQSLIKGILEA